MLFCWTVFDFTTTITPRKSTHFLLMTHFLASLTTNASLSFISASSTLTIKLLEPVTTAFLAQYVTRTNNYITFLTYVSLLLLCSGAIGFVGNPLSSASLGTGASLAFLSNILYGFRNIGMKQAKNNLKVRLLHLTHYFLLISSVGICLYICLRYHWIYMFYQIGSAISHCIYSYISLFLVLQYMCPLSHAIANILKRISVVLCLMLFGKENFTFQKVLSLGICLTGLFLYVKQRESNRNDETNKKERDLEARGETI